MPVETLENQVEKLLFKLREAGPAGLTKGKLGLKAGKGGAAQAFLKQIAERKVGNLGTATRTCFVLIEHFNPLERACERIEKNALSGDCRIWESKVREEDVNTAGVFLLDRSDSMEWGGEPRPIDVASRAVLAALDALRGIPGFASAAAAFPGVPNPRQRARGDWEDHDMNSVALLTGFDEPLVTAVSRYGISANGGTPLAMALWWGIWQLLLRPEPRKILLVATDGRPDESTTVHRALERAQELGIEALAIGIKLPDIEKFFPKPKSRVIQDAKEFPGALFGLLQANLTRRQAA